MSNTEKSAQPASDEVVVTGIDIPFMDLVMFQVKWVLAAIPALLILGSLALLAALFFRG